MVYNNRLRISRVKKSNTHTHTHTRNKQTKKNSTVLSLISNFALREDRFSTIFIAPTGVVVSM